MLIDLREGEMQQGNSEKTVEGNYALSCSSTWRRATKLEERKKIQKKTE